MHCRPRLPHPRREGGGGGKKLLDFLLPEGGLDTLDVLGGDINAPRQLVDSVAEVGATLVKCPLKLDFLLAPAPRQRRFSRSESFGVLMYSSRVLCEPSIRCRLNCNACTLLKAPFPVSRGLEF